MRYRAFCQLLVIALILQNCESSPDSVSTSISDSLEFRSYPIDLNAKKVRFTDLVETLEIISLEETENSLLGLVWVIGTNGDEFVVRNEDQTALTLFDKQGNYLSTFDRHGEGPEEYKNIWSYWFKGDTIKLFDNASNRLVQYLQNGTFLKAERLEYRPNQIFESDDDYWLDLSYDSFRDTLPYKAVKTDKSFANPEYQIGFENAVGFPIMTPDGSFKRLGNEITYHEFMSDTAYIVKSGELVPFIHFDLGDDFLWRDETLFNNSQKSMDAMQNAGKVWSIFSRLGNKWVHFTYIFSFEGNRQVLLNRATGQHVELDLRKAGDENLSVNFLHWEGETALISFSPLDLEEVLGDLDESQYSFAPGSSLEVVESSENPVLLRVTFKDF